jgi:hypothetical protein
MGAPCLQALMPRGCLDEVPSGRGQAQANSHAEGRAPAVSLKFGNPGSNYHCNTRRLLAIRPRPGLHRYPRTVQSLR